MNRVAVTGYGGICPLGEDIETIFTALRENRSGITLMPEWESYQGLRTRLAGAVRFDTPEHYSRKQIRSMGRVALMATRASELALIDAGLSNDPLVQSGNMGIAFGSSTGSTAAIADFAGLRIKKEVKEITSTTYIKMMPHTTAANVGLFFGMQGRIIPASSACTSGSHSIGYAFEAIRHGYQTAMLAGGAEELCVTIAAVFDVLFATSGKNSLPMATPSPFDQHRDGLVVSEGACTLVLEDMAHAQARGAKIYAEIVGFGTNSDGTHITSPNCTTMQRAMELALRSANIPSTAIGYVNAHATATELGDIAESQATNALFGKGIPISSSKGALGHTLGASGALEAWLSIEMMRRNWYAPTLNLTHVDPRCADLDYIMGTSGRRMHNEFVMSNNFAFGGINTSLIFRNLMR